MYQISKKIDEQLSITLAGEGVKLSFEGQLAPNDGQIQVLTRDKAFLHLQVKGSPIDYAAVVAGLKVLLEEVGTYQVDSAIAKTAFEESLKESKMVEAATKTVDSTRAAIDKKFIPDPNPVTAAGVKSVLATSGKVVGGKK